MQYSPKLKKAMAEIKAILLREDIAAIVILHNPGFTEYLNHINTSYSCAWFEGDALRIRARLKEDFKGDKDARDKKITDTVNMVEHFVTITGQDFMNYDKMLTMLKEKFEITNDNGDGHTSNTQQNN